MYLPDVPCHVIQLGNNRETWFYSDQDYQIYLDCLEDASHRDGVRVHAYLLMTNHVNKSRTYTNDTCQKKFDWFDHAVDRPSLCTIY